MIPELVESLIDEYVPKSLRERADRGREELDALYIQLHNTLRISYPDYSATSERFTVTGLLAIKMRVSRQPGTSTHPFPNF